MQGSFDVWVVNSNRGVPTRMTFGKAFSDLPIWSPDGSRVAFRSNRNGHYDLFEKPANGLGDDQPLLISAEDKAPQDWSQDGRFLLYLAVNAQTAGDIWALPLSSASNSSKIEVRKPFPVVQTNFDEVNGQFSPDGHWIAYRSNESGQYEVYVRPFPESGETAVCRRPAAVSLAGAATAESCFTWRRIAG
jgi:serine/threonine-protein kinase